MRCEVGKEPYLRAPVLADLRNIEVHHRWNREGEWGEGQPQGGWILVHLTDPGEARRQGSSTAQGCRPSGPASSTPDAVPKYGSQGPPSGLRIGVRGKCSGPPRTGNGSWSFRSLVRTLGSSSWSGDGMQLPGLLPHDSPWP